MDMGHEIDMVVDTGIHHTWRSQDLNNERLWVADCAPITFLVAS
jgi:hypothetical protein